MKPYNNPDFKPKHINFLYQKGLEYIEQIEQWKRSNNLQLASHYQSQLEAIVRLMESITVFNIGDGINNFRYNQKTNYTLLDRFYSFQNEK